VHKLLAWSLSAGCLAIVLAQSGREGAFRPEHLVIPAVYALIWVASLAFLARWPGGFADPVLVSAVCALTGIGLAALSRLDPAMAVRQLKWVGFGVALFTWLTVTHPWERVRSFKYVWAAGGLLLLVLTALFGVRSGGARSWLDLGFLSFQPVEVAKICAVLFLASYLAENRSFLAGARPSEIPRAEHVGPVVAMAVLFAFALAAQRDLGAALILVGLCVWMLVAATGRLYYAVAGGALIAMGGAAAVLLFDHVRTRFQVWIDPWSRAEGPGYQIVESMFALAGGGFFGTGFGLGLGHRIPAVETDFIYSLIVEEAGFIGAAALLFLLAVCCVRALAPSEDRGIDDVVRLGTAGFSIMIALQSFLIVGGVTRLLPVTGVTLPFVSYGGSSMISSFIQLGLVHSALALQARRATEPGKASRWIEA